MRKAYRRYLIVAAVAAAAGLAAVAVLNVVIDPFGAYRLVPIAALDDFKAEAGGRIGKAETLRRGHWDVVVLGSSRAQVGVNPYDRLWGQSMVANAALGGTNIYETVRVLKYTLQVCRPRQVIFLLDFVMFDGNRKCHPTFTQSRFNDDRGLVEYHVGNLLGAHATFASWQVLVDWARRNPTRYDDRGHVIRYGGWLTTPARERFERTMRQFVRDRYRGFAYSSGRVEDFREIVRQCTACDIELMVAVTPIHALQLETMRQMGLWDDFERFKRDLVAVVAQEQAARPSAPTIGLWDFTGYKSLEAEPIPPAGDMTPMKWYWESSHFTEALGAVVLRRMLHLPTPDDVEAGDFGAPITPANIGDHLTDIRRQRDKYARDNPAEIAAVAKMAEQFRDR